MTDGDRSPAWWAAYRAAFKKVHGRAPDPGEFAPTISTVVDATFRALAESLREDLREVNEDLLEAAAEDPNSYGHGWQAGAKDTLATLLTTLRLPA